MPHAVCTNRMLPVRRVSGRVWAWLRVVGGLGIVAVLGWRLGTAAFVDGLRAVDPAALLAALGIGVLTTVCSAWRWRLVAGGLGIRLPLGTAVADYYRALFLNAALPGGVLGDVHRAVRHGRDVGDVRRSIRAVVVERTAGQVVLVAVAVPVLLAGWSPGPPSAVAGVLLPVLGCLATVTVLLVVGLCTRGGRSRRDRMHRVAARYGLSTWRVVAGVLLSSAAVLAGHLATFVVAARAANSAAPLSRLLPLMLLALLAMAIPLNVGGWGPREGVTAWAFGAVGLGVGQGLTVAVVYGLLAFVAALPGAGVLVGRWLHRRVQGVPERSDGAYRGSTTSPGLRTSPSTARCSVPNGKPPSPTKRGARVSPTNSAAITRRGSSTRPAVRNYG